MTFVSTSQYPPVVKTAFQKGIVSKLKDANPNCFMADPWSGFEGPPSKVHRGEPAIETGTLGELASRKCTQILSGSMLVYVLDESCKLNNQKLVWAQNPLLGKPSRM